MYLPASHAGAVVDQPEVGAVVWLAPLAYSTSTDLMALSAVAGLLPSIVVPLEESLNSPVSRFQ